MRFTLPGDEWQRTGAQATAWWNRFRHRHRTNLATNDRERARAENYQNIEQISSVGLRARSVSVALLRRMMEGHGTEEQSTLLIGNNAGAALRGYRGIHLLADLGWGDFDIGCSAVCPIRLGQLWLWQKWFCSWARRRNIPNTNLSQPNPGLWADGPPCRGASRERVRWVRNKVKPWVKHMISLELERRLFHTFSH